MKLFNKCDHDYEFVKEVYVYTGWDKPNPKDIPSKIRRVYICKKCLKVKKIKVWKMLKRGSDMTTIEEMRDKWKYMILKISIL